MNEEGQGPIVLLPAAAIHPSPNLCRPICVPLSGPDWTLLFVVLFVVLCFDRLLASFSCVFLDSWTLGLFFFWTPLSRRFHLPSVPRLFQALPLSPLLILLLLLLLIPGTKSN
jgi:hypothetical protein